ncbi:MAG: DUF3810 domain-containing protein [Oscillospiraceae bacterium]|jgi:hypothetical protein|nr:DUF3810 domain-containing protein [Oscillospiraceae bacterium]
MKHLLKSTIPLSAGLLLTLSYYITLKAGSSFETAAVVSDFLRYAIGRLTSLIPFSVYEFLIVLMAAYALLSLSLCIIAAVRTQGTRIVAALGKLLPLATIAVYVWAGFLWLWCSLYYTTPFYDGVLQNAAPSEDELAAALTLFIDGANANAPLLSRDGAGHITEDAHEILKRAPDAVPYDRLIVTFPRLASYPNPRPKPMVFSEIMSITHFTGVYFALTGEANVNTGTPGGFIAATAAHELAHSHGVAPEDEANFAGIAAAVLSDDPVFRYSGYLLGLTELGNALYAANPGRYTELSQNFSELIRIDFSDNHDYWEQYQKTRAVTRTVNSAYDGYLKSNGQKLGIQSYGACVNLLTEWVRTQS